MIAVGEAEAILHFAVARSIASCSASLSDGVAEPLLEVVHLGLHFEQRLEREARLVHDRAAAVRQAVLRQIAERQRVGLLDDAGVGLVEARQHPQQRRLAGAVRSAQADAIAIADLPGDVLEQGLLAERFGESCS